MKKPGENLPLDLRARAPHFAPRAKAMISLFMHGGPSHVDLLDPKPELSKRHGTEYDGDVVFSFVNRASKKLFGSPWKFAKHGQCGTEVSELLPETAGIVDDICVIRSMHTGHNGHEVSIRFFHGGIAGVTGRPTMGSWLIYGLGQRVPAASRPTWCSPTPRDIRSTARATGRAGSCPRCIKGPCSGRRSPGS